MTPHRRALALTLAAFAVSLGALGAAALVSWARCDGDECSTDLAIGIVGVAPAMLVLAFALLLLRLKTPLGAGSRALSAAAVAAVTTPLVMFLLNDAIAVAVCVPLLAVLVFLLLPAESGLAWPASEPPQVSGDDAPAAHARSLRSNPVPSRAAQGFGPARYAVDAATLAARAAALHERAGRLRLTPMQRPSVNGRAHDLATPPSDLAATPAPSLDRAGGADVHLPPRKSDEAPAPGSILARR